MDVRSARLYGQFSLDKTLTLQAGGTVLPNPVITLNFEQWIYGRGRMSYLEGGEELESSYITLTLIATCVFESATRRVVVCFDCRRVDK